MDKSIIRTQIHNAVEVYGKDLPLKDDLAARIRLRERKPCRGRWARTLLAVVLLLFCGATALAVGASLGKIAFREGAVFRFFQSHRFPSFRSVWVFNWLIEAAVCGGLLIIVFLLFRPLVRKIGGNRAVCLMWALVAVRLLVPIALPNPLMNECRPPLSTDAAARPLADQVRARFSDACLEARWEYEQKMGASYAPTVPSSMAGNADRAQVFWNAVGEFGLATSYGWTGTWALMGWALVAGLTMALFIILERRKRRREGGMIGYLIVWTAIRHACTALQWFNPLVWLASHVARVDMERALAEDQPRAAKGRRVACAVIAGLILTVSFGTAEYKQAEPETRAAATAREPESPFEAWDRAWDGAEVYSPALLDTPEAAAARAERLRGTRLFCDGSQGTGGATVERTRQGWIVDTEEASYALDEYGALLSFSRALPRQELKPRRAALPEAIRLYVEKYARRFAAMAGEGGQLREIVVEQSMSDGMATYIPVRVVTDGEEWYLLWRMKENDMQIEQFSREKIQ